MAVDKIKPLKLENIALGGTEDDVFPTEANPNEDYVTAKGVSFENSDGHLIDRAADGQLQYIDTKQVTPKKFSELINFSYKKVPTNEEITIAIDQQMFVNGTVVVNGQLNNFGEIVFLDLEDADTQQVIPPADPENFSHFKIASGETKIIPSNQQMTVFEQITNLGQLNNLGDLRLLKVFQEDDPEDVVILPGDNFSYKQVNSGETKIVPTRQQMIVVGQLVNLGQLNVLGELALISASEPDYDDEYLPPYKIDSGESFTIKNNRLMFLPRSLINLGQLNNFGELALGGL